MIDDRYLEIRARIYDKIKLNKDKKCLTKKIKIVIYYIIY